jgi:hypothetical protein
MTIKDLAGNFSIIGNNQDKDANTYKGTLELSLNSNYSVTAKWCINNTQEQFGTGFFKDNTLVINFYYHGFENKIYNGTVVYKCLTKDIFEGFWFEEEGNPNYIGTENCFRIKDQVIQ